MWVLPLIRCAAQGGGAIPFNTQFFQDDYDDGPAFDDVDDGVDGPGGDAEDQDLLSATGPKRRVRPEFVNYAKRAKRVDVRKLKENIWKNLDIVVPDVPEGEEADAMVRDLHFQCPWKVTASHTHDRTRRTDRLPTLLKEEFSTTLFQD